MNLLTSTHIKAPLGLWRVQVLSAPSHCPAWPLELFEISDLVTFEAQLYLCTRARMAAASKCRTGTRVASFPPRGVVLSEVLRCTYGHLACMVAFCVGVQHPLAAQWVFLERDLVTPARREPRWTTVDPLVHTVQTWLLGMKTTEFWLRFPFAQKHNPHRPLFLWKNQPFILHSCKISEKDLPLIFDGKESRDLSPFECI